MNLYLLHAAACDLSVQNRSVMGILYMQIRHGDCRYWSKDLVINFIEVYKANPCLWKIKSKEYANKNLKTIAYDKLIDICKTVNPEAKKDYVVKKIQSFRGSFRKEIKKVLESKRSGAGEDDEVPTASKSNVDTEIELVEENEDEAEEDSNESELLERNNTNTTRESVEEENETVTKNRLLTKSEEEEQLVYAFHQGLLHNS
ncbi:hypothetical protein NQ318_005659 [Aromia moschata]|uniref:MADF domain-containing protein n=1 Tax=Aromia moschata TaxID=1265417 RepID=A0AAV8XZE5_9CUCU|nr:hypothetical protein NQ318_005659 [Aromia moschata]